MVQNQIPIIWICRGIKTKAHHDSFASDFRKKLPHWGKIWSYMFNWVQWTTNPVPPTEPPNDPMTHDWGNLLRTGLLTPWLCGLRQPLGKSQWDQTSGWENKGLFWPFSADCSFIQCQTEFHRTFDFHQLQYFKVLHTLTYLLKDHAIIYLFLWVGSKIACPRMFFACFKVMGYPSFRKQHYPLRTYSSP